MKPQIKARWVKALRSGKYKQAKGALHKNGKGFCCLGVLTDLYIKEKNRTRKRKLKWGRATNGGACEFMNETGVLPFGVTKWAGLSDENPRIGDHYAADHNDGIPGTSCKSKRFPSIAKLIEANL